MAIPAEPQPVLHHVVIEIDPSLVVRSEEHQADLIREFRLISFGSGDGLPRRLADLVVEILRDYTGVQEGNLAKAHDALANGESVVRLEMDLPFAVIDAVERIQGALEEADAYCLRGDGLLTLAAPDDIRDARRWFVEEIARQVRASASAAAPAPASGDA